MQAVLVVPNREARRYFKLERVNRLAWSARYLSAFFSLGVLIMPGRGQLDGFLFRCFRDYVGVWIETTAPRRVCRALGVPVGEPGIVKIDKKRYPEGVDATAAVS